MAQEVEIRMVAKTKEAQKQLEDYADSLDDVAKATDEVTESTEEAQAGFDDMPGSLGKASQGLKTLNKGFKTLLSNPIGLVITAIVAALTALVAAFKSTKEGAETFQRISAGLGAALDVLRDVLVRVGKVLISIFTEPKEAIKSLWEFIKNQFINRLQGLIEAARAVGKILKNAFSLDFEGVKEGAQDFGKALVKVGTGFEAEQIRDGLKKIGQEIKNITTEIKLESAEAARLLGILQQITDTQRDLSVERAQLNADIAQEKRNIEDITLSYADRIAALDGVLAKEAELLARELKAQETLVETIKAQNALSDSNAEALDRQAQAEIQLAALRQASAGIVVEASKKRQELINQEQALIDAALQAEIDAIFAVADAEIEATEKAAEVKKKAAEADKKIKEQVELSNEQAGQAGLSNLISLTAEGSAVGKTAAVAQATIDTYVGAQSAFAQTPGGILLKSLAAAIAVATGLKSIKNIIAVKIPGGKGVPVPSVSTGGVGAAEPSPTDLINQQPEAAQPVVVTNQAQNQPIKAYVVSRDVTNQQDLDKRIASQAEI